MAQTAKIALSVTTYKKPKALIGWLESVTDFGSVAHLHVADDNDGECEQIVSDYHSRHVRGEYPYPIAYSTGANAGIAKNKNRGIKWFMSSEEAAGIPYLILSDDDIRFRTYDNPVSPGVSLTIGEAFIQAHEATRLPHITGYLPDYQDPVAKKGFFAAKPLLGEDDYLYHYSMSQGILLSFTREILAQVGYFNPDWPGKYGYEHSLFSARVNRLIGRCPEAYPILKSCHRYVACQGIPNNYTANAELNSKTYWKRLLEVYNGVGLTVKNPGV